ncbi:hypothetical protein ACFTWF_44730 [Rhodococcus sp. NPDC056960]|jgi:hypothetical protein|uniref:hypothetical protein n=1 Tax=Rhodococcus sp. NPDC056960 TaxID=3345982 RepID=UPI00363F0C53
MSILSPRRPHQALPAWPSLPDWSDLMAGFEWRSGRGLLVAKTGGDLPEAIVVD